MRPVNSLENFKKINLIVSISLKEYDLITISTKIQGGKNGEVLKFCSHSISRLNAFD